MYPSNNTGKESSHELSVFYSCKLCIQTAWEIILKVIIECIAHFTFIFSLLWQPLGFVLQRCRMMQTCPQLLNSSTPQLLNSSTSQLLNFSTPQLLNSTIKTVYSWTEVGYFVSLIRSERRSSADYVNSSRILPNRASSETT